MVKKKTKKCNNGFVFIFLVLVCAITTFLYINRYEFFPQLIKNGVEVHFLTQNGEDKIIKYPYNSTSQSRFEYAITRLVEGPSTIQQLLNTYSDIPATTKIIAIIETNDKNIIDFFTLVY